MSKSRQDSYDEIRARAHKASVCRKRHDCHRFDSIMNEWYTGHVWEIFEVWDPRGVLTDTQEVLFGSNSKKECEDFIQASENKDRLYIVENGRCLVCDAFEARKAALAGGRKPEFLIVAYGVSRHYGGSEEGGWFYDRTTVLEVRSAFTFEGGRQQCRELKEKYPAPRYDRGSCANHGEDDIYIQLVYSELDPRMPKNTPPGKPIYE